MLKAGNTNRRVAETSMNRESSRSHAVLTVSIKSTVRAHVNRDSMGHAECLQEEGNEITNVKHSRLHLIDLAGSERQKDTKAEGAGKQPYKH